MLPDRRRMPDGLMRFLYNVRYLTLIVTIIIVGICGYWASRFTTDCSQDTAPPPGSPAAEAALLFAEHFSGMNTATGFMLYIKSTVPTESHPSPVPPQPPKLIDMAMDERFNHFDFHLEYWCKTGLFLSQEYIDTHPGNAFFGKEYNATTNVGSYASYRAVMSAKLSLLGARQYISPGNNSVSITITYNKLYKDPATPEWARQLEESVEVLLKTHGLNEFVEAYVVSLPTFLDEISTSILNDLYRMFLVVIPIALVIFGASLSSGKLLLLPICVLIVALFISAAIMDGLTRVIEVNSMSPGVMVMMLIAFTFDYTYFIASQWRREMVHLIETGTCHADEVDLLELMKSLYATAGKTIFISCHTIVLCSVGIAFFNVDLIRSMGVTIVVTAEVTGLVALFLPVAMLISFPNFFFATLEKWCNAIKPEDCVSAESAVSAANALEGKESASYSPTGSPKNASEAALLSGSPNYGGGDVIERHSKAPGKSVVIAVENGDDKPHTHLSHTKRSSARHSKRLSMIDATRRASEMVLKRETAKAQEKEQSRWAFIFRFAEFVTGYPQRIVFVIFAVALLSIMIPFAVSPSYSNSINQYVPRSSPVLPGWRDLKKDFRAGSLFSYTLIMETKDIPQSDVPKKQQHIIWSMINELPQTYPRNFDGSGFSGVLSSSMPTGGNISSEVMSECWTQAFLEMLTEECKFILVTSSIFQPSPATAPYTFVLISLDWDPSEGIGKEWYSKALTLFDRLEAETGFKLYLRGYAAETFDTIEYAEGAFSIIILVTVGVLFCCIFLAFGSVVIALIVLTSVTLTVLSAFGMLALAYRFGGFDWTGWSGISGTGAISWQIPFTSFLASAAVALNYEIIYVTKVFEMRWKGFDTQTSIVLSVTATMREVSIGALMMVVTFFGLLLSEVSAMNEMGFVFAATALAEGFVVRLFFTPPLMALLGHYNWFPLQFCPSKFTPPLVGAVSAGVALDDAAYATDQAQSSYGDAEETNPQEGAASTSYQAAGQRRHTRESKSGSVARTSVSGGVGHRPQFTKEEDAAAREIIERYRRSLIAHGTNGQEDFSMRFSSQIESQPQEASADAPSFNPRNARQSVRDSFLQQIAGQ